MSVETDSLRENPFLLTNNHGDVKAIRYPLLQFSPMGLFILYRLIKNRDIKMLITSKGSTTGTGKTYLAIILSRLIHRWGNELFGKQSEWTAEEYAFMNAWEYISKYESAQPGDVLISDELEILMDKRRSQRHQNVLMSWAWQKNRYKNVISIGTAPSLHNLDKRAKENTDIWVNVTMQGRANVYLLTMNDFVENVIHKRFKNNITGKIYKQSLLWLPPDNDADYHYLHGQKKDMNIYQEAGLIPEGDNDGMSESEIYEKITMGIFEANDKHEIGLTQEQIANDVLQGERSQQWVSKLYRNEYKNGEK